MNRARPETLLTGGRAKPKMLNPEMAKYTATVNHRLCERFNVWRMAVMLDACASMASIAAQKPCNAAA